jgi:uncharacterized protein
MSSSDADMIPRIDFDADFSMTNAAAVNGSAVGPLFLVKRSEIHGRGVFAACVIAKGTRIVEYKGRRIAAHQAVQRTRRGEDPNHTWYFTLSNGQVIDAGIGGNAARYVNHACKPNCEALEEEGRVFICARRRIAKGEELTYDYCLSLEERHTPRLKLAYACACGKRGCRRTMLLRG